ncbi:uncharacterized protein Z520_00073 [Fonsecaea multimorphosa CBS 102226]|uniref:Uncharacterized protein n=1 Tax=Fonsecaea multimorphosa CBS 102226 TaxID=1442371 RepID=A0A0D2J1Y2_9EURO|nr:uncharacterized protein Z520_00073 [Fonsecaea multimorphosa CBS 102226]KIY03382.1 hypothetical protein Z520_00073 [Fonsecaea multimorphosa CBS 102226]OAL33032.1 hypothetical protein AYO22_00117 [Fonsecaea multimorphosa]
MGRKLASFAAAIEVKGKQLDQTFKALIEEIRPNPLAAKANATLVLRRNQELLDLQKQIINFRSEVVDRFESGITALHQVLPNIIPSYNLSFHLHLDVLEYRVVGVRLADALKLSNHLLPLKDPSFGVQRLGLKMIQFAYKESVSCVNYCQGALENTLIGTNPSIEAEIRVQQLQFMLFAKSTRAQLSGLGHPVNDNTVIMDGATVKAGLEAVSAISRRSPGTCAGLMATAQDIATAFEYQDGSEPSSIPKIKNDYTKQVENLWGRHELGFLSMCSRSHPYSAKTFSDGCPNCEKQAQLSADEVFRESGKHLFEQKFLRFMHSGSLEPHKPECPDPESSKSAVQSVEQPGLEADATNAVVMELTLEERLESSKSTEQLAVQRVLEANAASEAVMELTAEERFLAAMRKGPPKILAGVPCNAMKPQNEEVGKELAGGVDNEARTKTTLAVRMDKQELIRVEPEKELTMEEKFLVAMRKIGKN